MHGYDQTSAFVLVESGGLNRERDFEETGSFHWCKSEVILAVHFAEI